MDMSTKASTYISVCTPKSFKSLSAIILPMALGIEPMPNCRQAPSQISGTTSLATAMSTSLAAPPPPSSSKAGFSPSTIMSTSSMWMQFSNPPKHTGMFLLTSTMTVLAHSHTAFRWEPPGPKLNQPCSSMGATWNMATSRLLMQLR